ncbi:hypothetical protein [Micromonospora sp. WMMD812]|uniref:hypothetical protein n=1 Tax=Micromonospora sp. WMMD812 TaxID=3015152 RepID=UPI00248B504F|nr:hypothetical protein [Micromonospora sp. WMMD812]WBB67404.1 hypothetical protein O7603_30655 [Micromonospora sp. WMMD812]
MSRPAGYRHVADLVSIRVQTDRQRTVARVFAGLVLLAFLLGIARGVFDLLSRAL